MTVWVAYTKYNDGDDVHKIFKTKEIALGRTLHYLLDSLKQEKVEIEHTSEDIVLECKHCKVFVYEVEVEE